MQLVRAHELIAVVPSDLPALHHVLRDGSERRLRVCAVGDLGLSGRATRAARQHGSEWLFKEVRGVLASADVTFGNLESPLAGEIASDGQFSAPLSGAKTLRDAGFTLVHLANNHVGEYGARGLLATIRACQAAGLSTLGAGATPADARQPIRTDIAGVRVGWLGCGRTLLPQQADGPHYWEFDEQELQSEIERVKPHVDVLVVSIHIGLMYIPYPRPEHKLMAEKLMKLGADLILMHHAHVLQGIQATAGGQVCCYNLGNFLYDWEEGNVKVPVALDEQNEGAIFVFDLDCRGVTSYTILPTIIDEECRVRWAVGARGLKVLRRLERISETILTDYAAEFDRQRASRNTGGILKVLAFHARRGHWRFVRDSLQRARWEHVKMAARWMSGRLHKTD